MKRIAVLLALFDFLDSQHATAAVVLDQLHVLTKFESQGGVVGHPTITYFSNVAQTVRVGVTGQLVQIDFWANRVAGPFGELVFEVRPAEADGSPVEDDNSVLADVVIPADSVQPLDEGHPPDIGPNLLSLDLSPFNLVFSSGELFAFNFRAVGSFGVLGDYGPGGGVGPYDKGHAFRRVFDLMDGKFYGMVDQPRSAR